MTRAERRQQWDHFIAAYKSSGQSVKEWCAANGVKPNRLWYRLRRTCRRRCHDRLVHNAHKIALRGESMRKIAAIGGQKGGES